MGGMPSIRMQEGIAQERRNSMAFVVCEPCVGVMDRACVEVCPVDCICEPEATNLPPEERKEMLYIDPDECIDCDACVPECPVEAIFEEEEVPEEWEPYIEINAKAFE